MDKRSLTERDICTKFAKVRPVAEFRGRYLAKLFSSPFAEAQRGINNSFSVGDVTEFVVPLPPLAEQHRLVAKVDELMALCDLLETSLTSAGETRKKPLDALLAEALALVNAAVLQEAGE